VEIPGTYRDPVLRTLRQPRYVALSALMLVVALVCIAAGCWQIARFDQKVHENDVLRRNAALPTAPVARVLPHVGARTPSTYSIEFRPVRATGSYDVAHQTLVRNRTVGGVTGFLVLTPFRTSDGTLLVVRGFAGPLVGNRVPVPPTPPAGTVTITGRVEPAETGNDQYAALGNGQVESINPVEQAARLRQPVFDGYVQLFSGQPGSRGLHGLPAPNLSNPAGGALEPQHFAYIIQWFLFAILAVAAPFAMARAEMKLQRKDRDRQLDEPAPAPVELSDEERRAAKLADRYGRAR
jgi:cytochrome oxidase assembly protein ShyY1